jgi:hypothetical protein
MRRTDAGRGSGKAIFSLLVVAFVVYASIKIVPVYLNNYELQTYIQDQTPFWLIQRVPSDGIRARVLAKAQDLTLPISKEQVQVEAGASRVTVNIDYTVPIDLKVYTLTLHFTPHSENRAF